MTRFTSTLALATIAVGIAFGVGGCAPQTIDMSTVTEVIDVRTPAEFATGHLDGAVNVDWEGSDFAGGVATLDHAGNYVLYCRSGNRAGQAKTAMEGMGFEHVTNAGSVDEASAATGLAIVQP